MLVNPSGLFFRISKTLFNGKTVSILSKPSLINSLLKPNQGSRFYAGMAPIIGKDEALRRIDELVKSNKVMIFSKSYCPYCQRVKGLFHNLKLEYHSLELDNIDPQEAQLLQDTLKSKTGQGTVPNVFVNGNHIGGCDDTFKAHSNNRLLSLLGAGETMDLAKDEKGDFKYDLLIIGGGSGGLAAANAASKYGKKVGLCDFVKPSPAGTAWGLGGTCVNVGCIPKKLMHQAALLGQGIADAEHFGWNIKTDPKPEINWEKMVGAIQDYIASLNWGYRVTLRQADVAYFNAMAEFVDDHTVKMTTKKGTTENITAQNILVAVGGRPNYPDIPGAKEFGLSSDDVFSLPHHPGKTLFIGASYIALECAGFFAGFGIDTTVMVRSILLRGFDQEMANHIGNNMEEHGVRFLRGWVPTSIEKIKDGTPPTLLVKGKETNGTETISEEFNTVVFAIGRSPLTGDIQLEKAGVKMHEKSGKIVVNPAEQSNVGHIFAIGDVAHGRQELTPTAIEAGTLLARRLFGGDKALADYQNVPTTVFTPMEYGCVGLSEEQAIEMYGLENLEIYHTYFQPLECTIPKRLENKCFAKLICVKNENEKVVGFHYLGPNAGEVTQGFALGIRLGAKKEDFNALIGIHPTCAELFTTLKITKASNENPVKTGC